MQKVITATGKEYDVKWCGASTIDFALRFEVRSAPMTEILTTFTNPAETETLTHDFDNHQTVYRNYTVFKGVDTKPAGTVVVALSVPQR